MLIFADICIKFFYWTEYTVFVQSCCLIYHLFVLDQEQKM